MPVRNNIIKSRKYGETKKNYKYNNSEFIQFLYKRSFRFQMRRFKLAVEAFLEAEKISKSNDWQIYYNTGILDEIREKV